MSIPALDGTVECNDFCVLIFLILIEKKETQAKISCVHLPYVLAVDQTDCVPM